MTKIGISFVGISYGFGRDWQHCFHNHKQSIIDPYVQKNNTKIYLTSYTTETTDCIIELYQPTKHSFIDIGQRHQVLTYIRSLEQLREQELDFVISTRFDIHFHKNILEINFHFDKFNALFKENGWWNSMHFTTDNIFAFPYSMLEDFISVLKHLHDNPSRTGMTDLHQVFYRMQCIVGEDKTNIVSDIDELSNYNSFYSLCNEKWGICK